MEDLSATSDDREIISGLSGTQLKHTESSHIKQGQWVWTHHFHNHIVLHSCMDNYNYSFIHSSSDDSMVPPLLQMAGHGGHHE